MRWVARKGSDTAHFSSVHRWPIQILLSVSSEKMKSYVDAFINHTIQTGITVVSSSESIQQNKRTWVVWSVDHRICLLTIIKTVVKDKQGSKGRRDRIRYDDNPAWALALVCVENRPTCFEWWLYVFYGLGAPFSVSFPREEERGTDDWFILFFIAVKHKAQRPKNERHSMYQTQKAPIQLRKYHYI